MLNNEPKLLKDVLLYENGHIRRTKHILMVHSLAKSIGSEEGLTLEQQQIVQSAAILHDIAIKKCKRKYNDTSIEKQKLECIPIAKKFLKACNYVPSYTEKILDLIYHHHDYDTFKGIEHQVLIEADLIVNCLENKSHKEKASDVAVHFHTKTGKELLHKLMENKDVPAFTSLCDTGQETDHFCSIY